MVSFDEAVAFGSTMFASACLNNLFVTYYVEMFMAVPIAPSWFYGGQVVFMVWNAINDPLVGWLCDRLPGNDRRLPAIRMGGPLWALSFVFTWYSPGPAYPTLAGIHFVASLCLYDTMLTLVEVNHAALLADISTSVEARGRCNMYAALFAAVGSFSSFFSHLYWDKRDLQPFRRFAWLVAFISAGAFLYTAAGLRETVQRRGRGSDDHIAANEQQAVEQEDGARSSSSAGGAAGAGARAEHRAGDSAVLRRTGSGPPQLTGSVPERKSSAAAAVAPSSSSMLSSAPPLRSPYEDDDEFAEPSSGGRLLLGTTTASPGAVVAMAGGGNNGDGGGGSLSALTLANSSNGAGHSAPLTPFDMIRQMMGHHNLVRFGFVNALQVFDCSFEKNFFAVFLAQAAAQSALDAAKAAGGNGDPAAEAAAHHLTTTTASAIISLSFVMPWVGTVFLTPLIERVGLFETVHAVFYIRAATAAVALAAYGVFPSAMAFALCLLANRVATECSCRLFPLVTADLVDEDRYLHARKQSMSGSIVGTAALVAKTGQSLAPMLGYALLTSSYASDGADDTQAGGTDDGSESPWSLCTVALAVPLVCTLVQSAVWKRVTLRGKYLKQVKLHASRSWDALDSVKQNTV